MPKVSVIIPTYNRLPLVKEAVDSALAQSFADFEIVVVDDGSTDGTLEVIEAIKDLRIRCFYKENGGVASARNFGFMRSKGRYICNLDSDDLWPRDFLEIMVSQLEKNPEYGAAYSRRTILLPDGTTGEDSGPGRPKSGWITKDLFLKKSAAPIHTSGSCFCKEALQGAHYDESLKNAADYDYWLRLSTKLQFLFVPQASFLYRVKHAVSPRASFSRENGNRIRILERFYFQLEGKQVVPQKRAYHKISHTYCSVGKTHLKAKHRAAAVAMFRDAIRYWPYDLRLYMYLLKAYLLSKKADDAPHWQLPPPLSAV